MTHKLSKQPPSNRFWGDNLPVERGCLVKAARGAHPLPPPQSSANAAIGWGTGAIRGRRRALGKGVGLNAPSRSSRPRRRSPARTFQFRLARSVKGAVLDLPEVRRYLEWQRRLFMVRTALALMESRLASMNRLARLFGIAPSGLCRFCQAYRRSGARGLYPKPMGKRPKSTGTTPCLISFTLRTEQ